MNKALIKSVPNPHSYPETWRAWLKPRTESSGWFSVDAGNLDVKMRRRSARLISGERFDHCLEILVVRAIVLGQGSWTRWWPQLLGRTWVGCYSGIWVENVINPRFADWFRRQRDILEIPGGDDNPSFWLRHGE